MRLFRTEYTNPSTGTPRGPTWSRWWWGRSGLGGCRWAWDETRRRAGGRKRERGAG
jgi:hypothetical protein